MLCHAHNVCVKDGNFFARRKISLLALFSKIFIPACGIFGPVFNNDHIKCIVTFTALAKPSIIHKGYWAWRNLFIGYTVVVYMYIHV